MQITLAGSALSRPATDAQQEGVSLELAAFDGEVGNSTVVVPDPTGVDEVVPGLAVVVSEGTTVLLDGRIVSEGRERGSSPAAGQKQDTYQVDDPNTFMYGFRVVADRPEESDYARMAWFFSTYLPAADTTFVLNTSTSTMVAASYASDGVADIMRDAIDLTGKTLFIHDKAAGGLCAHWHALTGGHTCGLTISDTFGDPNGTTVWYPQNPARVRDGADLANDILAYGADETIGPVNVTDPTSISTYDADGKLHQTFANFPAATDLTTLAADANRLLETNKDPRDSFTATIGPLDDAALALIRAGDIITVTSEILGLSASPQRISRLRLTVSAGNTAAPGLWDATLTMGAPVRGPGGRFGRSVARPPTFPTSPGAGVTFNPPTTCFVDYFNRSVAAPGWDNDWGFSTTGINADPSVSGGAGRIDLSTVLGGSPDITLTHTLPSQTDFHATMTFSVDAIPSGTRVGSVLFWCYESPALARFSVQCIINNDDPGTGQFLINTPTSGSTAVLKNNWVAGPYTLHIDYRAGAVTAALGALVIHHEDGAFTGDVDGLGVNASYGGSASTWQVAVDSIVLDSCAPSAGMTISTPEFIATSDGTTDTYNTNFAYQPGSLTVLVDGLPWVASGYHETDPTTGEWEFDQVPAVDDVIRVTYMAA